MDGATVQANIGARYEKTRDPRRMLTHKLLNEAIRTDWDSIKKFLPARTATYLEYQVSARKAQAWNEGEQRVSIDLPLKDGWYVPDGNPFAIPNGRQSSSEDPEALYLSRYQDRSFSGPVGRDDYDFDGRRYVYANGNWSNDSEMTLTYNTWDFLFRNKKASALDLFLFLIFFLFYEKLQGFI